MAFEMTRKRFADESSLDTLSFRHSIIYYLKQIHGIRDGTFGYGMINKIFTI